MDADVPVEYDAERLRRHPVFDRPHRGSCAVVLCHFNPCNYRLRNQNVLRVLDHLDSFQLPVFAAELRCGAASQAPPVLPADHPRVRQAATASVLWQKENLWNLVARDLPKRYRNVLCLDADVILTDQRLPDAIEEALAATPVVHPFTRAVWLDPTDRPLFERMSFGLAIASRSQSPADKRLHFPGFAFALRREFWDVCGGLYNGPLGGGDWMFTAALCGQAEELKPRTLPVSRRYWDHYAEWAACVYRWCAGSMGYVEGSAFHLWHGSWENRRYDTRHLRLHGFDPYTDLAPNPISGVVEWTPSASASKPNLVHAVEEYFGTRLEDATVG
jgi:hypothetical protein